MRGWSWTFAITLALLVGGAGRALAQEVRPTGEEPLQAAQADPETADRQALRDFLGRKEVQQVARTSGMDLRDAERGLLALDGERLTRAADQAREFDRELGAAQGEIRLSATVVIIILLLIIIIVVAA